MANSPFDPEAFLNSTTTEASEKRPPLPVARGPLAGDYVGVLGSPKIRPWQSSKDPTKSGLALDIPIAIEVPPDVQAECKLKNIVQLTHGIFLDVTAAGALDYSPGANRQLRAYREATGLNTPGSPFSLRMLEGKTVRVKVKHEPWDHDGISEMQDRVDGVAKM